MINIKLFIRSIKSFFDFLLALILLIILSPLFSLIALFIFFEDGGPIIFRQSRIGFKGKLFTIYKFRSMKKNSEFLGDKYYCFEGDKRITKIGNLLRKYSLDELPQLINILKKEMSFVGPRPPIHDEFKYEKIDYKFHNVIELRKKVKPGITGYAQIKSRNDLTWNEKLKFDEIYLNMSEEKRLLTDLFIIFLTFKEILYSKGIYDKRDT